jgi:hypothetical protein
MKAGLALLIVASLGAAQQPVSDVEAVRARLDAYLTRYQIELSTLVADEQMSQHVGPPTEANRRGFGERSESRRLKSEVAFVGLPGDAGWLGFRRVVTVNGKPLKDAGPPLAQLLSSGYDDRDQAHLLLEQSASQNLGAPRTTNLPNLPLEMLHPRNRHRFAYRHDGHETIRNIKTMRMVLNEQSTPTIIQRPEGGDMASQVTAWIDETTGRLIRAEVKTSDVRIGVLQFSNVVWVDFKQEEKLGLLVPVEMREEFFAGRFRSGTGTAKYTNYRKFQTTTRIVPPSGS